MGVDWYNSIAIKNGGYRNDAGCGYGDHIRAIELYLRGDIRDYMD
jgi:hypothetical protein